MDCGREIGIHEHHGQYAQRRKFEIYFALDIGSVRDSTHGEEIRLCPRSGSATTACGSETCKAEGTLRDGVNLSVRGSKRGHDKDAALETVAVAHSADGDVDRVSLAHERGKIGGDHDGREIVHLDVVGVGWKTGAF